MVTLLLILVMQVVAVSNTEITMSQLDKKVLRRIIKEEVQTHQNEIYWYKQVRPVLLEAHQDYLQLGFNEVEANRQVLNEFIGPFAKLIGGAAVGGEAAAGETGLGLSGEAGEGFKTALEVKALDTIVRTMGLKPYRGLGIVVKSCMGKVIDRFEDGEIANLFSGSGGCQITARNVSIQFLECLEDALAARLLAAAADAIFGDMADDMRDNVLFGAFYKNLEDHIKEYFRTSLLESGLEDQIASMICDNMRLDGLLSRGAESIGDIGRQIFTNIGTGLRNLDLSFDL